MRGGTAPYKYEWVLTGDRTVIYSSDKEQLFEAIDEGLNAGGLATRTVKVIDSLGQSIISTVTSVGRPV